MLRKTVHYLCGVAAAVALVAQNGGTEAPAGFDTPLVRESPARKARIMASPSQLGTLSRTTKAFFEKQEDANDGIGPVFNAASCVACHANPVTGGASQITEVRVGHLNANGGFANPTVPIKRRRRYDHWPISD
jgi:hypothetical protein